MSQADSEGVLELIIPLGTKEIKYERACSNLIHIYEGNRSVPMQRS